MTKITLFAQIIGKIEKNVFNKLVKEKQTDKYNKGFNSWTHLVSKSIFKNNFNILQNRIL